jgi:hypothetical protein
MEIENGLIEQTPDTMEQYLHQVIHLGKYVEIIEYYFGYWLQLSTGYLRLPLTSSNLLPALVLCTQRVRE